MITFFNKIGNSWIAKVICAALGISMMAFWGLGGLSSGFSGNDHKAVSVGSSVITVDQINQKLNQERNKISSLTGQTLSTQQAVELGLLDLVIQQSINEALQQQIFDKIGLIASDEAVRKYVERNPLFQNGLGNFDANLFYGYMGQLKINQTQLSEQLKQELIMQHLMHPMSLFAPNDVVHTIALAQKEKREVKALFLPMKDIDVGTPSENTLKEYYEAYQEEFMAPEYRKIQLLSILPDHFAGDKDQIYDKMYQTVQDLEDALGEGIPLNEVAQKLNLKTPTELTIDIDGKNTSNTLADKKLQNNPIVQELFTLAEGEATAILEYENGFLVAEVENVIPSVLKPYASVQNQVKKLWQSEQQKEKLPELTQKVLDGVHSNTWGKYTPIRETLERTKAKRLPAELLSDIYNQKIGNENAKSYSVSDGSWIVVVDRIIQNNVSLSEQEEIEARAIYNQDLLNAFRQSYAKDLKVKVNETTIKKFFTSYSKDEE